MLEMFNAWRVDLEYRFICEIDLEDPYRLPSYGDGFDAACKSDRSSRARPPSH